MATTGIVNPSTFEWIIPSLQRSCVEEGRLWIWSPDFDQRDLRLYMGLCIDISKEWIGIYLFRKDDNPSKSITCTIKMKGRTDVVEITKTTHFCGTHLEKTKFLKTALNSIFQDSFTVICDIACNTAQPVAGLNKSGPKGQAQEVQAPKSVRPVKNISGCSKYPFTSSGGFKLSGSICRRLMATGIVNLSTFEWIIPSLRGRCEQEGRFWIRSPDFEHRDLSLYLGLCIDISEEWIKIYLARSDYGQPKSITYTIKMKGRTDVAEITETTQLHMKYMKEKKFLITETALNSIFQDSFTVICDIACNTVQPVAEREYVTCASQTEVPDCMSCSIQTEDENRSSLDRKEREYVTCASQTEVRDCISCVIQTEDEDRSSVDMKSCNSTSCKNKP